MCQPVSGDSLLVSYTQYKVPFFPLEKAQCALRQFQEELKKSISDLAKVRIPFANSAALLNQEVFKKSSQIEELVKSINEQFRPSSNLKFTLKQVSSEKLEHLMSLVNEYERDMKLFFDTSFSAWRSSLQLFSDPKDSNYEIQYLVGKINFSNRYAAFCTHCHTKLDSLKGDFDSEKDEIIKTLQSVLELAQKKAVNKKLDQMEKIIDIVRLLFFLSGVYELFLIMLLTALSLRKIVFRTPIRSPFLSLSGVGISMIVTCCSDKLVSLCQAKVQALTLEEKSIFEECQKILKEKDVIVF